MKKNFLTVFLLIIISFCFAQKEMLKSGPMSGYVTFREAAIWVQTIESVKISALYWDIENSSEKYKTLPIITSKDDGFTGLLIADKVLPGKTYHYTLEIDNKTVELNYECKLTTPKLWQWRSEPSNFSILAGSCTYVNEKKYDRPGKPYGGGYELFNTMAQQDANIMIWLGDNTYYREVDWDSKTGIYSRNTHTRTIEELQPFLGSMHHYAIWDDHDFGPNDAVGTFYNKDITLDAFKDFWANPNYNVSGKTGISGQFGYEDIDFFMLDNRWNRTPKYDSSNRVMLGKQQLDWLKSALKNSKASFKLICLGSQFLNPLEVYENMANFPAERNEIIDFITQENIKNVIFLTGDRHHSEVSKLTLNESNTIYDITCSPLTSRARKIVNEKNPLREKGSLTKQRCFAKISFSEKLKKRMMTIRFYDAKNKLLYQQNIISQQ